MSAKKIHIISFDVPFPADYGGVIDVFYRIKALNQLGFEITLHCFEYGRGQQRELEKYCASVFYYKRTIFSSLLSKEPFIVTSRKSPELLTNLLVDEAPILFEGLHTCAFLNHKKLKKRFKIARTHNIEHDYYTELAKSANGWRKIFFKKEAKKLKDYEVILEHANHILTIQQNDLKHFKLINKNVSLLPASVPEFENKPYSNTGEFCLFHGNLSVAENEIAATWIIKKLKIPKDISIIIAGKNPSNKLVKLCKEKNIELIGNPTEKEMNQLIKTARIHLLYTEQSTGLKLKLINSLTSSGHVIVNSKMVEGTSLLKYCSLANTNSEYSQLIKKLILIPLAKEEYITRQKGLSKEFNTKENCVIFTELVSQL